MPYKKPRYSPDEKRQLQPPPDPATKDNPPPRKTKLVQTTLFDDSAVDDWGDSAELRKTNNCQPRLL